MSKKFALGKGFGIHTKPTNVPNKVWPHQNAKAPLIGEKTEACKHSVQGQGQRFGEKWGWI